MTVNVKHHPEIRNNVGILVTNLGTPDAPTTSAVRRYLREFLSDPRVVEIPRAIWWFILNFAVLPFRPQKSAEAYKKIWRKSGSPLRIISENQAAGLQQLLSSRHPNKVNVRLAMRYGNPAIKRAMTELKEAGAKKILVLPLYPQYSATTTASTFDAVNHVLQGWRWQPEIRTVSGYCDDPGYIRLLCNSIRDHWRQHGRGEHLLFSFHGLPKRNLELGDPYSCFCQKTARLVAEELGLDEKNYTTTFQSRFGRAEWLQPYTDKTLELLPHQGVRSVDVICPGFSADCLETLEEIQILNRKLFMKAGGEEFNYISALNTSEPHIQFLTDLIDRHIQGWV